ncbi:MAG: hypothetical protein UW03_C0032G0008 [Candidatus Peregrinibacteria bacterium GW2011_GWA2_43_8]|nr:MAG: hypothetical protein UW03_C0032G0008 [Candidatus Peregrinibacteria bacterium GW2011_GWA2_43_8]
MKETLKEWVKGACYELTDLGCFSEEACDYPDIAKEVCEKVKQDRGSRGVLVCGTGIGMSMVANKFPGIRAALCANEFMAQMAREHNDAQIICMGGRVVDDAMAKKMLEIFLKTNFSGEERHVRRVRKIEGR